MKNILFVIFTASLFFFACDKNSDNTQPGLNEEVTIGLGETVTFDPEVSITFDSVLVDSRCPCEADCIWEGEAVVRLTGQIEGATFICPFRVTGYNPPTSTSEKTFNGYNIRILEVFPYPCNLSYPIPQEDYEVKIIVTQM